MTGVALDGKRGVPGKRSEKMGVPLVHVAPTNIKAGESSHTHTQEQTVKIVYCKLGPLKAGLKHNGGNTFSAPRKHVEYIQIAY